MSQIESGLNIEDTDIGKRLVDAGFTSGLSEYQESAYWE
jgi:hypothetical protein